MDYIEFLKGMALGLAFCILVFGLARYLFNHFEEKR